MSDLQLGLIVIGVLIVVAVYAFNRYQEQQLRRKVESRFAQRPDVHRDACEQAALRRRLPAFGHLRARLRM